MSAPQFFPQPGSELTEFLDRFDEGDGIDLMRVVAALWNERERRNDSAATHELAAHPAGYVLVRRLP